ncbi:P-loop NTPase fold protein [Kribbella sp. VKM Ac-2568]|uniref:P-loop NTPase fold protein n=1 Tax=Kribbella sp. VKM Ac-2568 TaxID=2512219 RepID=UPI00104ABF75|nr:P-loop NTPase fold protein [Kribbella sp. VKM Ac-2568]TCM43627.1 KAP-like P-loop domain-containing protein [Kribbella sp. VKM Ac-2568]
MAALKATTVVGAIEIVLADLFEVGADILVIPCSTTGSIAPDIQTRLDSVGVRIPTSGGYAPGDVMRVETRAGRKTGPVYLLAAVVPSDLDTTAAVVEAAAVEIGRIAAGAGGVTAFPLLGTGAGGLEPDRSLAAIVAGFRTHQPDGPARICVLNEKLFAQLSATMGQIPGLEATDLSTAPQQSAKPAGSRSSRAGTPTTAGPVPKSTTSKSTTPSSTSSSTARDSTSSTIPDSTSSATQPHVPPTSPPRGPQNRAEGVPTHTDSPALVDELGRKGFARVLARRIRDARTEEARNASAVDGRRTSRGGAFLLHLHAPWGAGKTSLLNFLAAELRSTEDGAKRCVVVDFNAWRHQRIEPPWWWLMTALYSGAVRDLRQFDRRRAIYLRLREWFWRIKGGWPGYLALLLVAAIAVVIWRTGWLDAVRGEDLFSMGTATGFVVTIAALVTPVLTVWGLLHGAGRWIFATSARGARRFIANTSDPMRLVQEHLADLAAWIQYDVVVMIDDLDRCKGPYVVELLEGIQTLFRDVPVTYVIAADRDWLADSYAAEYTEFVSVAAEPGRPVGYLFLEKTFQISTGLPQAEAQIEAYWGRILRSPSVPGEKELETARTVAKEELGGQHSQEARRRVADNPGSTAAEIQARLEIVAVEMVTERAQVRNTHTLEPFRPLLGRDPNPRTMKRLVNAYGIARGIETLQGFNLKDDHDREQETALWTILTLRWPRLGSYLARYPERIDEIGSRSPADGVPAELQPLFGDPEVVAVVRGDAEGVTAALNGEKLRKIVLR